jgi:hypothetical protein
MKQINRTIALLVCSAVTLLLAGCVESQPDYGPIGDGLKAIGVCLVVVAVVKALASLLRIENRKGNGSPGKKDRGIQRDDAPEGR